jgi:hypothetical protein
MNGNDHDREDFRPYFVIPYWTQKLPTGEPPDNGDIRKPLPKGVTDYLCPGIHASPYTPGNDLTVKVDVRNFGAGNASSLALVTVWWTVPTLGFVVDPTNLIGVASVSVKPRGTEVATTLPMTKLIPVSAPPHICLLVRVFHQLDLSPATPKPAGDRHWAQRNLSVATAQPGIPNIVPFMAANPFADEAEFTLQAQLVPESHHRELARVMQAEPISLDARFTFSEDRNFADAEPNPVHRIQLRAGEQRPMHLRIELGAGPQRGQFACFQVTQYYGRDSIGSLGVAIQGR